MKQLAWCVAGYLLFGAFTIGPITAEINLRCPNVMYSSRAFFWIVTWPGVILAAVRAPPAVQGSACWSTR